MPSLARTIGILAHVDAGKTSLTESILHYTGTIKNKGSVDKGSTITDQLSIEKERGISIQTATVDFEWNEQQFYLVDTPGHIDFAAEVDRVLSVLDGVILVISAKAGIQAHTLNLWEQIKERGIPHIFFINKMDQSGIELDKVIQEIESDLGCQLFGLNYIEDESTETLQFKTYTDLDCNFSNPLLDQSHENLADLDEQFLEQFLEGEVQANNKHYQTTLSYIRQLKLSPYVLGSAKMNQGIATLLQQIEHIFTVPHCDTTQAAAKVFKLIHEPKMGFLAHIRSYGKTIVAKENIYSQALGKEVKINQLYKNQLGKLTQIKEVEAGEVAIISCNELLPAGDILGEMQKEQYKPISEAVLTVQVVPKEDKDEQKLGEALEILDIEDPQLDFHWYKDEHELHIKILGNIQIEILKESLQKRFALEADFMPPKVVYKETPKNTAEGFVRYWLPKPCWAIMTFKIEPGELGSGVQFESKVRTTDISTKYQNEVKRALPWALRQGIKGWEITDLKITLIEGSEHNQHSRPGDFLLATPMGVLRGIENTDTDLLEPMFRFEIKAHQDYLGNITRDLTQMRAQIEAPQFEGDFFTLGGRVAVAESMNYQVQFNATTSGKGRLKLTLDGYEKTEDHEDKHRPYKGVSPLNESQWILHNRGAFKADERLR